MPRVTFKLDDSANETGFLAEGTGSPLVGISRLARSTHFE